MISPENDNHWSLNAACRNKWDLFDSVLDENFKDTYPHLEEALELCATCPVITECRTASAKEPTNIWAGQIKGGK